MEPAGRRTGYDGGERVTKAHSGAGGRLSADFWRFFVGQTVSQLGSSVTFYALPLLIFRLTGSALDLGIATAVTFLPYLLFGLPIGAWVDRVDRKRLMILTDLGRAAAVAVIPLLTAIDALTVEAIYLVAFVNATLSIAFAAAQFAAIPSLVASDNLIAANGRIQASFSAAMVLGPPLAGLLVSRVPISLVLLLDAGTFLASAASLALVRRSFNQGTPTGAGQPAASWRRDVVEGLRFVLGHPVLRSISLMMALVNFIGATTGAQMIYFAKERLSATDAEVGLLLVSGSVGPIVFGLLVGPLRRRWSFGVVALGALAIDGLLTMVMAWSRSVWLAMALLALIYGLGTMFNINTASLRQQIVPNHLLGRVMSIAGVLAFAAIPLGSLIGGWAIERAGNVALVFSAIGVSITTVAALFFIASPLGRAERYLSSDRSSDNADGAGAG